MESYEDIGKLLSLAIEQAVERKIQERSAPAHAVAVESNGTTQSEDTTLSCGHYFLDEAGDMDIFGKKGRVIIGQEGCSRYCMLGLLQVIDPVRLAREMDDLRASLLADPYFKGVPSFDPAERKTALFFHAKDDLPEVRREVFRLLVRSDVKFSAVVNDKQAVLRNYILPRQAEEPDDKYHPNHQYDYNVRCLFKGRLHKMAVYNIHFARRGKSDRTEALRLALEAQQQEMNAQWAIAEAAKLNVSVHYPYEQAGCQAVDYFLWAIQRLYEMKQNRYYNYLIDKISFVNDRNRKREGHHGGTFYTRKKPLSIAALQEA